MSRHLAWAGLYLPPEMEADLREIARREGKSFNQVVALFIEAGLMQMTPEECRKAGRVPEPCVCVSVWIPPSLRLRIWRMGCYVSTLAYHAIARAMLGRSGKLNDAPAGEED